MKFTIGDNGVDQIDKGISGVFKSLAMAPYLRQQTEQQAGLRNAQMYQANMSGNKAGAEAENTQFTLGQRKAVPDLIAADPGLTPYMAQAYKLFGLTGDTNAKRIAEAGSEVQSQGYRDRAADNIGDTSLMNKNLSIASGKVYTPFDNVGNTGYSIDKATGDQAEQNPVLAKLFAGTQASLTNQRNAAAGASSAAAGLSSERRLAIQQGGLSEGVDDAGNPIIYRAGTAGKVAVLPGIAPLQRAGGADAAMAKARARVVEKVFADPLILPEERAAEVERRMALIGGDDAEPAAKSPATTTGASTMKTGMPKGIPEGSKQIGTSGGKPVFQAPNGKKYIVE